MTDNQIPNYVGRVVHFHAHGECFDAVVEELHDKDIANVLLRDYGWTYYDAAGMHGEGYDFTWHWADHKWWEDK